MMRKGPIASLKKEAAKGIQGAKRLETKRKIRKEEMQVGDSSEKAKRDATQRALTNAPLAQVTLSSGQSAPCPW